jgi:hypothetical protein
MYLVLYIVKINFQQINNTKPFEFFLISEVIRWDNVYSFNTLLINHNAKIHSDTLAED